MDEFSDSLNLIVVAHGLVSNKVKEKFLELRKEPFPEAAKKLSLLKVHHNTGNSEEFVAFLGLVDEEKFNRVRNVGDFLLEEYLFTGIRHHFGMCYLANYNQFICTPPANDYELA